jgi:tRNA-specific 2-thiouridylase
LRALSLFSGGLDSQLAVKLIQQQGIEVEGINIVTPFFGGDDATKKAATDLNIKVHVLKTDDKYLDILHTPVYGFGKNHNPCIDCHGFMLRKAGELMSEIGAAFIITGEVLGQRPMSQTRPALNKVDKLSGLKGYILRPLSAQLLPETIPEQNGWVDRSRLLSISGRSRNQQINLAAEWGITNYPSPAGGCLLTQENFSNRLEKYFLLPGETQIEDLHILKYGRHFYLDEDTLLVVGRNQHENQQLEQLATDNDYLFKVIDRPGPLGLLRKNLSKPAAAVIYLAAAIVARYSDAKLEPQARVKLFNKDSPNDIKEILDIVPLDESLVPPAI